MKITIYRVTTTKAPRRDETGTGYSLYPASLTKDYQEHDDGGQDYVLPATYTLGRDAAGSLHIYDVRNLEVAIEGRDHPALLNDSGCLYRLRKA